MLIERVLDFYTKEGKKPPSTNPLRLSNSGKCARALAYQRFASVYPPEPLTARALLTFREGDRVHAWLKEEFQKHFPGQWGFEEERFYLEVDRHKIPGRVDGIADLPGWGLTVVEIKSMSNYAFRRALRGELDYQYRCQLNSYVKASGLDNALWVCYRKETSHLLEIFVSKKLTHSYLAVQNNGKTREYSYAEAPEDLQEGDIATVYEVFSEQLAKEVEERFRKVLNSTETNLPGREYGPEFRCKKCGGSGKTPKETKSCSRCAGGGVLPETDLDFPCSYCGWVRHCWSHLEVRFESDASKPRWIVRNPNATEGAFAEFGGQL